MPYLAPSDLARHVRRVQNGLVLGYGMADAERIPELVGRLREAVGGLGG